MWLQGTEIQNCLCVNGSFLQLSHVRKWGMWGNHSSLSFHLNPIYRRNSCRTNVCAHRKYFVSGFSEFVVSLPLYRKMRLNSWVFHPVSLSVYKLQRLQIWPPVWPQNPRGMRLHSLVFWSSYRPWKHTADRCSSQTPRVFVWTVDF